jgi:hypothetical protein
MYCCCTLLWVCLAVQRMEVAACRPQTVPCRCGHQCFAVHSLGVASCTTCHVSLLYVAIGVLLVVQRTWNQLHAACRLCNVTVCCLQRIRCSSLGHGNMQSQVISHCCMLLWVFLLCGELNWQHAARRLYCVAVCCRQRFCLSVIVNGSMQPQVMPYCCCCCGCSCCVFALNIIVNSCVRCCVLRNCCESQEGQEGCATVVQVGLQQSCMGCASEHWYKIRSAAAAAAAVATTYSVCIVLCLVQRSTHQDGAAVQRPVF